MVGYVGYGNNELRTRPAATWGSAFICPRCGETHKLTNGMKEGDPDRDLALFYSCGGTEYLGAVDGRLVVNAKPTVSGNVDL